MRQLINLSALKSLLKSIIIASRLLGSHSIFSVIVISRIDWLEILYAYSLSQPSNWRPPPLSGARTTIDSSTACVFIIIYFIYRNSPLIRIHPKTFEHFVWNWRLCNSSLYSLSSYGINVFISNYSWYCNATDETLFNSELALSRALAHART